MQYPENCSCNVVLCSKTDICAVVFLVVWFHMIQGSMCIGVACSVIGLGVLIHNIEGKTLKMTITVHRTCACILGISGENFIF